MTVPPCSSTTRPARARRLWVSLPPYLLALWLISNAAPRVEAVVFGLGLLALGLAAWAARRGRRGWLIRLYALAVLGAVTVLLLEAMLHVPGLVGGGLANHVYSGHNPDPDGVYVRDPELGLRLRPNLARWTYWNGHWWRHEVNARGYRGPLLERADAVFVGDSLVYGHGVNTDQTVPAQFGARTGRPAANLGIQGISPIQGERRFAEVGRALQPRQVFLCCVPNDVTDATDFYPPEQLRRYLVAPVDEPVRLQAGPAWRPWHVPVLAPVCRFWGEHLAWQMRTGRLLRGLVLLQTQPAPPAPKPAAAPARPGVPSQEAIDEPFDPLGPGAPEARRLGWEANLQAIRRLKAQCMAIGAELILFDVGYPRAHSQAVEGVARELGVRYSPAGRVVLEQALAGRPMYLVNDGHWTPEGCDTIAAELVRMLP